MEDLQKDNDRLKKQVKELERELQYQKRRFKVRQYKEEFAILPQVDCEIEDWPDPAVEWANSELKEKENRLKKLERDKENVGVQLYGVQQNLAEMQLHFEQTHENYNLIGKLRVEGEQKLSVLNQEYGSKKKPS